MTGAVLLALAAAAAYGCSDFLGGLTSRRTSAWAVATVGSGVGAVLVLAVALVDHRSIPAGDVAWSLLAGVGGGAGAGFLYRGFAGGRMGVVAPVSAVGAALLPAGAGLVGGERLGPLVSLGVVLALPGIALVAREPRAAGTVGTVWAAGLLDGVLAGAGFGLLFAGLGQVDAAGGWTPLALAQAAAVPTIVVIAVLVGGRWRPDRPAVAGGAAAGSLAALANAAFLVSSQQGYLVVAAVLTSLYPAVTVMLAAGLLRERLSREHLLGLALCGAAVALVAAG